MYLKQNCVNKPIMFFLRNGEVFKTRSMKNNVITKFFLITSIDKTCITFMQLRPCYICYNNYSFEPTYEYITMEKSVFCAYHILNDVCIRKCKHHICCFSDCLIGHFTLLPGNNEATIWKSNMANKQSGTLQIQLKDKISSPVKVIIQNGYVHSITSLKSKIICLDGAKHITIKSNGDEKVKGCFKIEMNSMIEQI
ncbi:S-Ena type endospore appendage [Pseudogracilibacillus auburnensis]|nr:S-Ena type endospore appendage [Pseudogracilibacillus auburnensis]